MKGKSSLRTRFQRAPLIFFPNRISLSYDHNVEEMVDARYPMAGTPLFWITLKKTTLSVSSRVNKIASKEKNRGKRSAPFFVGHCPVRFLDVHLKQSFPSLKRIPGYYRLILLANCDTGEMFNMDETSREQRGQS